MTRWSELAEADLVARDRDYVHVPSDELFVPYAGPIFATGSPAIVFQDMPPMHWYVDQDGYVVVLERRPGLWSDVVERRARRGKAT